MMSLLRRHDPERVALVEIERGASIRHGDLPARVDSAAGHLRRYAPERGLAFLVMGADAEAVVLYLACLEAGLPVYLSEQDGPSIAKLAAIYAPDIVLAPARRC